MAIFGSFGAHRGPKMACSNLFRPNITYPNIFTLIFSKKKEKKNFLNLTTLFGSVAHSAEIGLNVSLLSPHVLLLRGSDRC